ncbi:hypothetical protein CEQ90_11490 [Lewinellaceae bacterium SD302]|nr:hypothetical protein CEQ90_11490 [Lewinellaceae bacterium SD302]
MIKIPAQKLLLLLLLVSLATAVQAETGRYRLSWRDDPATTMTIGFEFSAGREVYVALGERFGGTDPAAYPIKVGPAKTTIAKGMRTCFVRLSGLNPETVYHFIVVDDLGVSRPMSFETAPNRIDRRLSFIAGGDSRNHRESRQHSNRMVAKLRPHGVIFSGDMTNTDGPTEWKEWLDDWQLTISPDGRLYPIIPARGNHESDNEGIAELFDVPNPNIYYSLNFCDGMFTLLTLNSMIPVQGDQLNWLKRELNKYSRSIWKMTQYHNAMRPHTSQKLERDDLVKFWAPVFYKYGVDLVMESDAHVVKQTYPIRPGGGLDSDEGFIRDNARGTTYIGEGGWGAPLRANNDNKEWTIASGRFNQIKWIWVNANQLEIRTVMTDESRNAAPVSESNRFSVPRGLKLWMPVGSEALVLTKGMNGAVATAAPPVNRPPGNRPPSIRPGVTNSPTGITPTSPSVAKPVKSNGIVRPNSEYQVDIEFITTKTGPVEVIVITSEMRLFEKRILPARGPGPYEERVEFPEFPHGIEWQLIVKSHGQVIQKYTLKY